MRVIVKILFTVALLTCYTLCQAQGGTWTWVKGANTLNSTGNIGTQGVANAANFPEGRYQAVNWLDRNGNFWIFGGLDSADRERQDLWEYTPGSNTWTWIGGPLTATGAGVYGTQGVPGPGNIPGARSWGVVSWTDHQGHLWMHGGLGYDRAGAYGNLDDMWMYDIATGEWTWMTGPATVSTTSVYGTLQTGAPANTPGGRYECNTAWVRSDGSLWTFGGEGATTSDLMNDMWKFDIGSNNWIWMSGPQGPGNPGNYGTLNVETASNLPPARGTYTRWQDPQDNFYIFGGWFSGNANSNDVWKYNTSNNRWTWIGGSDTLNNPGLYTSYCTPGNGALPPSRYENRTAQSANCSNVFWTFGGYFTHMPTITISNDLWNFNAQTKQWTWVSGSSGANAPGSYGTINVPAPTNVPSARFGECMWLDQAGTLWMWGGMNISRSKYSDMWQFVPDTACIHSSLTSPPLTVQWTDTDLCHNDSALLTITGGRLVSLTPMVGAVIIDSGHVSFRPTSPTTYRAIVYSPCGGMDTFIRSLPGATSSVTHLQGTICPGGQPFTFHGQNIYTPGYYTATLTNVRGCDSILKLSVSAYSPVTISISKTICTGTSFIYDGHTYTQPGTYSDTMTSSGGCDSIVILHLDTVPKFYKFIHIPLCKGTSVMVDGQVVDSAATFTDTLISVGGCDSIIITDVYMVPYELGYVYGLLCEGMSMVFAGRTISETGAYYDTIHHAVGCDSIIVMSLYVYPATADTMGAEICDMDSVLFGGHYISAPGAYSDTVPSSVGGCDSISVLILSTSRYITVHTRRRICPGSSISFGGQTITVPGIYIDTVYSTVGCDTIVVLHATMGSVTGTSLSQFLCRGSSLVFLGDTISMPGIYIDTLANVDGCDSIITLALSVISSPSDTVRQTICSGEKFLFSGQVYTDPGIYCDTFVSPEGCDSFRTLVLTVLPTPTSRFLIEPVTGSAEIGTDISATNASLNADTILWLLNNQALNLVSGGTLPISDTGLYCLRLIASTLAGCSDTSAQCIYVYSNAFYMPNAFTPNGDGINDDIEIFGNKTGMKYLRIRIFDRWGEKVFESTDLNFQWDGWYDGVPEGPGVFVYVLELTYLDGKTIHNKGSITLIK